jgi:hypothetical protein
MQCRPRFVPDHRDARQVNFLIIRVVVAGRLETQAAALRGQVQGGQIQPPRGRVAPFQQIIGDKAEVAAQLRLRDRVGSGRARQRPGSGGASGDRWPRGRLGRDGPACRSVGAPSAHHGRWMPQAPLLMTATEYSDRARLRSRTQQAPHATTDSGASGKVGSTKTILLVKWGESAGGAGHKQRRENERKVFCAFVLPP